MQRYFHRKCNRWDSCRQIPLVKMREEQLEKTADRRDGMKKRAMPTG